MELTNRDSRGIAGISHEKSFAAMPAKGMAAMILATLRPG